MGIGLLRTKRKKKKKTVPLPENIIAPHIVWSRQPFFMQAMERHGQVVGIPPMRCFFLQSCLRSLENVPGDVAECGVRHGKSALFLLEIMTSKRQIFLFDSFEGFSDPTPGKDSLKSAISGETGRRLFDNENPQEVVDRFAPYPNAHICKGWIPERFAEVSDRQFCLAHIDVDLYQPTHDSLSFFYRRLSQHGMIVCDDYGSENYPGAREAMDEFFADKPETPIEMPTGQAFIIKR